MPFCTRCGKETRDYDKFCSSCGTEQNPTKEPGDWGFEYKSGAKILGLPLLHISFKYRNNYMPVPARGVIAIGQFAAGIITFSQFGVGVVSVSQFTVAAYAVAQFGIARDLIAQIGIYFNTGFGQAVTKFSDLFSIIQ